MKITVKILLASAIACASLGTFAQGFQRPTNPLSPTKNPAPGILEIDCSFMRERGAPDEARMAPRPMPRDPRLVVFPYDANALYAIHLAFNRFTHLQFERGEKIMGSYVNDETEWEMKIAATGNDIFVRPKVHGATGGLTVITDRRQYEMELIDVAGCSATRYQRVSWLTVDAGVYEAPGTSRETDGAVYAAPARAQRRNPQGQIAALEPMDPEPPQAQDQINLGNLNTDYSVEGSADITPVMVADDGRKTVIKFQEVQPRLPALFAVGADGMAETVEYVPKGSYFIVNQVFTHGALLKLGKLEVRIRNRANSRCGLFDSRCRSVQTINLVRGD